MIQTIGLLLISFITPTHVIHYQAPTVMEALTVQDVDAEIVEVITPAVEVVPDVPTILKEIGRCESGNRQFNADGSINRGWQNPKDVGKYQINEDYWLQTAIDLHFNIYTEKGNTDMALYIYNKEGTRPWNYSKYCWGA